MKTVQVCAVTLASWQFFHTCWRNPKRWLSRLYTSFAIKRNYKWFWENVFHYYKRGKNMSIMLLLLSLGSFSPLWFDGLDHLSVCAQRSASTFPPLDFPAALTGGTREGWMRNILGSGPFPWVSNTRVESDTDRVVQSPTCFRFLKIFYFFNSVSWAELLIYTSIYFHF